MGDWIMEVFLSTLFKMLELFLFMAAGYLLNKLKLLPKDSATVISKMENYIFVPCIVINTFMKNCTVTILSQKWIQIIYSVIIMAVTIPLALLLSRIFTKDAYKRNIYFYSFAVANYSFMGTAVVAGVFPNALFDYMIFTLPLNVFVYSIGVAILIPQNGKKFSFKSFLNPIFVSLIAGTLIGLLLTRTADNGTVTVLLPSFIQNAIGSAASCMAPLAMVLTGFVIGDYKLKKLAAQKEVYIASVLRLILIPAAIITILKLLGTDPVIVRSALCALAMPLGLNTVVFPAAYGGDTTPGASMALISHTLSVATIPIMFALFL